MALNGWNYKREVIIDNIINSNSLSNYQICIVLDTYDLISTNKMLADGSDVRFVDSDDSTLLNYWIENIPSSGTKFWVKVPSIPGSSYKTIYMYYGNPTASGISSVSGTFIRELDNLELAFEFDNRYGHTVYDCSGNDYNGTLNGPVDVIENNYYYAEFDGSNDYIKVTDGPSLMDTINTSKQFSIVTRAKPSKVGAWLFTYGITGDPENDFEVAIENTNKLYIFWEYGSGSNYSATSTGTIQLNTLQHLAVTARQNEVRFYKNGTNIGSVSNTSSFWSKNSDRDLIIGAFDSTPSERYFGGLLGEYYVFSDILSPEEVNDIANNKLYVPSTYTNKALIRAYTPFEPSVEIGDVVIGMFEGYVYEKGVPVSRKLYLYRRDTGELLDTTTSSGNGHYKLETTYSGSHYIVCLDDPAGEDYNDLVVGNVFPTLY